MRLLAMTIYLPNPRLLEENQRRKILNLRSLLLTHAWSHAVDSMHMYPKFTSHRAALGVCFWFLNDMKSQNAAPLIEFASSPSHDRPTLCLADSSAHMCAWSSLTPVVIVQPQFEHQSVSVKQFLA
jgi:hypothetical protein